MKRQVVIVGAGPAGLLLAHLLKAEAIDVVVVERRSREHVEGRIRAGVLETVTTDLLRRLGIDRRLNDEGLIEEGFTLAIDDRSIRIDLTRLTGRHVTVYGQAELARDLFAAAVERQLEVVCKVADLAIHDPGGCPCVTFINDGVPTRIDGEFVIGCDGFHGPTRQVIAGIDGGRSFQRDYPFGWLGILADVPPCHPELIYANTADGFALASMRSPMRSRYYIQVPLSASLDDWPEGRLWDELSRRFASISAHGVTRGPALDRSIVPLRSFVFETMRHGRLFLAGDAAHIVPPTGAKGLNLAVSDVVYLAEALTGYYRRGDETGLKGYAARALARIWKAERFSWSLTKLMHRFPQDDAFDDRLRAAEFDYLAGSTAMQTAVAENYVGLPL